MTAVLVIEDDDRIRLSLTRALEDEGYEVSGAARAEEGLALQRREAADIVLIDLMLPGIAGFECIRQLRRDDDVPIVVVSARDDTHDIVAALEAGADRVVGRRRGPCRRTFCYPGDSGCYVGPSRWGPIEVTRAAGGNPVCGDGLCCRGFVATVNRR